MKILAIRGKNLASLEQEFEINFMEEPLLSAGLYAIVGPTGAGKSTILDALCLALYDDVPRFISAEQFKIEDDNQDNISLKDSRNILRKGSVDGFAEVDFRALNGDVYRARWSVRRARNKADGALQATVMQLQNLVTLQDVQGGKNEIKFKLELLIGLTFNQFTRTVLLAQGEFENFLKANKHEKAELLEKLTGTDIYSKISIQIRNETLEAKRSLDFVKQQINDVVLLSEEDLKNIITQKEQFIHENNLLKLQIDTFSKKKQWWARELDFQKQIIEAQEKLNNQEKLIEINQSRFQYFNLLETSLQIRDVYLDLIKQEKIKIETEKEQNHNQSVLQQITTQNTELEQNFRNNQAQLDDLEQRYEKAKPLIDRAKELDIQIKNIQSNKDTIQAEMLKTEGEITKILKNKELLSAEKINNDNLNRTLNIWFEEKQNYRFLVENSKVIISHLTSLADSRNQLKDVIRISETNNLLLTDYKNQLQQDINSLKEMNDLQPSEILLFREKLQHEKPCPVCGSTSHPYIGLFHQEIHVKEKELEETKKRLQDQIEKLKENIDKTQLITVRYETNQITFQNTITDILSVLGKYLDKAIKDWKDKTDSIDVLINEVMNIEREWNQNLKKLDISSRQIETLSLKLENESVNLEKLENESEKKKVDMNVVATQFKTFQNERICIFDGQSIDQIQEKYSFKKKKLDETIKHIRLQKEKNDGTKSTIEGKISHQESLINRTKSEISTLTNSLDRWLVDNNHLINKNLLADFMSKSQEWITTEKKDLTALTNDRLIYLTSLNERIENEKKHQISSDKPDHEESLDFIQEKINLLNNRLDEVNREGIDTELKIKQHFDNAKKLKHYEKDINEKQELYDQWAKLDDLLGSANGNKFKTIAQGYTLDVLLGYANQHLQNLDRRYKLKKIPNSLVLQVIDNDLFGEVRPVHGLSGGESFLISLGLALGLSSLSSNQMRIESLFIDEGFGALDLDTLNIAMDALENLQIQGRKIGIISHVENMKERITTQIQVVKTGSGSSKIKIVG